MSWVQLQHIWFFLIGVLFLGYSVLDGFDLGIGALLPFLARSEDERRALFNAVGPFWDGNEVWLLTGGGALFAAFPYAYATVFSGFYLALMAVLFALIFRATALEFYRYDPAHGKAWAFAFELGSFLPALLYGVALGNVIVGIPLDGRGDFTGTFFTLLRPYPLAIGLAGLGAILLQGAAFAAMKTRGELQRRAHKIIGPLSWAFIALFLLSGVIAFFFTPWAFRRPLAYGGALLTGGAWFWLRRCNRRDKPGLAFTASSLQLAGLWTVAGASLYPNLVRASNGDAFSLTLRNASSSPLTLKVMLLIALIGMPVVVGYTIFVYRIFRGHDGPDPRPEGNPGQNKSGA